MTKKELQKQIDNLEFKFNEYRGIDFKSWFKRVENLRELQNKHWQMLKDYLKVEEKEYAELEEEEGVFSTGKELIDRIWATGSITESKAVKKTKLVKKKK
jgi:hypothetical protein